MRRLAIAILVCAVARTAAAHQTSVKYVDLAVGGGRVEIALRVAPGDVTEPMGLRPDARPSVADAARAPRVAPYVAGWVAISSHGEPCATTTPTAQPDEDGKLLVVAWTASCAAADELALDFGAFFALDQRHVAILHVDEPNTEPLDSIVRASEPRIVLHIETAQLAWVRVGFERLFERDHLGFVLALVTVAMLAGGAGATAWRVRGLVPTLRYAALVLGAFTVAHLTALSAAALGVVALAPRLVCALAALSVVYTAIEDMTDPAARRRLVLALGFGLVQGLALAIGAPTTGGALACFAIGIELGQLVAALIALPVALFVARRLGAARYRRIALPAISIAIAASGTLSLVTQFLG